MPRRTTPLHHLANTPIIPATPGPMGGNNPLPAPLGAPPVSRSPLGESLPAGTSTGPSSLLSVRANESAVIKNLKEQREAIEAGGEVPVDLANGLLVVQQAGGPGLQPEVDKLLGAMVTSICRGHSTRMKQGVERAMADGRPQALLQIGNSYRSDPIPSRFGNLKKHFEQRLKNSPSAEIIEAQAQVRLLEREGTAVIEQGWERAGQLLTSFDHETRVDAMSFVDAHGTETQTVASIVTEGRLNELLAMMKTAINEGDGAFAGRLGEFVGQAMPAEINDYTWALSMKDQPDMQATMLPPGTDLDQHLQTIVDKFADKFPDAPSLPDLATYAAQLRELREEAGPLKSLQNIGLLEASAAGDLRSAIYSLVMQPDFRSGPSDSPVRVEVEAAITRVLAQELPKIVTPAQDAADKITQNGLLNVDGATVMTAVEGFKDLDYLAEELGGRSDQVDNNLKSLTGKLSAAVHTLAAELPLADPTTKDANILIALDHASAIETWVREGTTAAFESAEQSAGKFFVAHQRSFKDHPLQQNFNRLITHLARIDEPLAERAKLLRDL